ncbi:MAG TPA: MAC/perforin domain-containing protein [Clostridia bacterium]|nr:MAC/perforin domain-containing protein [Clostridia bacterium]
MKSRLWKTICIVLCFSVLLSFLVACSKEKNNDVDSDVKDTLTVYVLGDGANLPYDAYTTYEIDDDSIVMVSEEGFVSALNEGETIITVNGKDSSEKYKVIVEDTIEEDKRFGQFANTDDSTGYVGAGINLLTSGNPSSRDCIIEYRILDTKKVVDAKQLKVAYENKANTMIIKGDSMESFAEDYSTQIKIGGTAKYGKMFSASIDTDFSSTASMKGATQTSYLRFFSTVSKLRLTLSTSKKKLDTMLTDEFKEDLFGTGTEVLEPKDVIEKYGSHLILSAVYGGRMDFTYFLSSTETSTSKQDMADVSAAVSASVWNFSTDINGKYSSAVKSTADAKNVSIHAKSHTIGGGLVDMSSIDSMRKNYPAWLNSLNNINNYAMIGLVNANSLVEIWSFLPDGVRKNEFITYFATEASKSYNNLISKYSKTSTSTTTLEFGEYPQSQASEPVTDALNGGNGEVNGSFFAENDVLLYEGARYLKYISTKDANSYKAGKTYYFKFEPIKWKYFDTDSDRQKLYTTEAIIDCRQWNNQVALFPPYESLSINDKLELLEHSDFKYDFPHWQYSYYWDRRGYPNFLEFIKGTEYSGVETYLEEYYNDLIPEEGAPSAWEASALRHFLNDKFVSYSFTRAEQEKLGLVHTYYLKNGSKSMSMDYVSIAPNEAPQHGGIFFASPIRVTDFAYARGLKAGAPYWASGSNFINKDFICVVGGNASTGVTAYSYDGRGEEEYEDNWDFVNMDANEYCGIKPTIAFKKDS